MKVTTLACIQGAWLPNIQPSRVLDIGAGTGVLSHMVAQKYSCNVDAVEIDPDAFAQLNQNSTQNPWKSKINCIHENIMLFANHTSKRYDFIISNPPFFHNHQKSPNRKINLARHANTFTLARLIDICEHLLNPGGKVSILLPAEETKKLQKLIEDSALSIESQLIVFDTPQKQAKAIVTILSRRIQIATTKNLIIKQKNGHYSQEFISLLKDYYLYL